MKYEMIGYGHKTIEALDNDTPRGISSANSLFELAEQIAYALWVDQCRYVTIYDDSKVNDDE